MTIIDKFPPLELSPPYRGGNGNWYTSSLFLEQVLLQSTEDRRGHKPPFTLERDVAGYVCLRKTFVAMGDPTGYEWSMKYLGDYAHWNYLMRSKWFQEAVRGAQEELLQKLKAQALRRIVEIAGEPSAQSLVAAKYLAEQGWEKRAGRPSKEALNKELKAQTEIMEAEAEDLKRIGGLKIIKGGKSA